MSEPSPQVARWWSGATEPAKADEYEAYLLASGVPDLRATPGNQGVFLLRRDQASQTEFVVLSLWQDEDSIRRFAGEDIEKAVYYPQDRKYLRRMDPFVTHFQVRAPRLP